MNQMSSSQPLPAPAAPAANLSAESVTLAPENILEAAPMPIEEPDESPERRGVSYCSNHWGINE